MKRDTTIVTAGRKPHDNHGIVNPPVYHASTVLMPTYADVQRPVYQRSVSRWRHYETHLETVFPILEPFCRTFGYD